MVKNRVSIGIRKLETELRTDLWRVIVNSLDRINFAAQSHISLVGVAVYSVLNDEMLKLSGE